MQFDIIRSSSGSEELSRKRAGERPVSAGCAAIAGTARTIGTGWKHVPTPAAPVAHGATESTAAMTRGSWTPRGARAWRPAASSEGEEALLPLSLHLH